MFALSLILLIGLFTYRWFRIHKFYSTVYNQIEGFFFLLYQGHVSCKTPEASRFTALEPYREELTKSMFYNPIQLTFDLTRTTYTDWVANTLFWEEMNSILPYNQVRFMQKMFSGEE